MSKTQCLAPVYHKQKNSKSYECYPCGTCSACISRRASAWSFRLMQEEKYAYSAYFITLTYNDKNVPRTRNGFLEIRKRDLQLFFKRLRKMQTSRRFCKKKGIPYIEQPLKYFAVGEYGGKLKRPHYHVILFNCSAELVEEAWKAGHVHYGYVSGASVGYTMKYMSKESKIPIHRNDDRTPEFSLMSKCLGECYLSANMIYYHKKNTLVGHRCFVTIEGKQIAMPRYYRDRLYSKDEKKVVAYFKKQDQLRRELLVTADQAYEIYQFKNQKKLYGKKQTVLETPLQLQGISESKRAQRLTQLYNS